MENKKSCVTINVECCSKDCTSGPADSEAVPVGTVISFMGYKAPAHYLICDGTELNIIDYPKLSEHILREFGVINHFGGDGTSTFAVPDLRNEFLRGYHGNAAEQISGNIGEHKAASVIQNPIASV